MPCVRIALTSCFFRFPEIHFVFFTHLFQIRNIRNKDKPLMRRKSDLVEDTGTVRALMEHKRADEYLTTPPNVNQF